MASESEPCSERDGVVTVWCRSSVWAGELELLGEDLLGRLNAVLVEEDSQASVRALRFVASRPPASGVRGPSSP